MNRLARVLIAMLTAQRVDELRDMLRGYTLATAAGAVIAVSIALGMDDAGADGLARAALITLGAIGGLTGVLWLVLHVGSRAAWRLLRR